VRTAPGFAQELTKAWKKLAKLNPGLKKIVMDSSDPMQLYDALFGVTSGFNVTDINYFLALRRKGVLPAAHAHSYPWYDQMWENIFARTGQGMYWVAAPATLMKTERKLGLRP